jgi:ribosomal protein L11 methylase PrmA
LATALAKTSAARAIGSDCDSITLVSTRDSEDKYSLALVADGVDSGDMNDPFSVLKLE